MFTNSAKKSAHLLVLLACLVFSNHCLLKNACTSSAKSAQGHCHGDKGPSKKESSQQGSCCDQGCCAPVLQALNGSLSFASSVDSWNPILIDPFFEIEVKSSFLVSSRINSAAAGPPVKSNLLLLGLSAAPNAPPFLS